MTATKPDLEVIAVGIDRVTEWVDEPIWASGRTLVLCEMPDDRAATLHVPDERDLCTPGFVSGVVRALATAGIKQAGGHGVAALHHRAQSLAQAVQSIGRVLSEMAKDIRAMPADALPLATVMNRALYAISEVVESVAADVTATDPGVAARATLAAHGWSEGMFPALPGKRPHNWVHTSMYGYAWVEAGLISIEASAQPPAVCRAFATLAEETRP